MGQTQNAQAQLGYPNKPIRLVVPYGAGGVGDQTMRLLANKMTERIKQQIVIENRPSAGGILSMTELLRAPADGYTLGEMGNGQAISMSLFSNLRYDLLKDFSPLSVAGTFAILLAVPDRSPYKSLEQLVEDARRNPGKLNLGAINPGSTQNLSAHLFQQITGINATIVPYRTAPDLVTALLRSDVDLGFDYFAALQSVIGPGKVRIIATTGAFSAKRLPNGFVQRSNRDASTSSARAQTSPEGQTGTSNNRACTCEYSRQDARRINSWRPPKAFPQERAAFGSARQTGRTWGWPRDRQINRSGVRWHYPNRASGAR
jgi:tripartite-type tricarboxylate transporter receptor subunit TctC